MPKRVLSVLLLAGVTLVTWVPADAAKRRSHRADATLSVATISQQGTPPAPGSSVTSAGKVSGSSFGAGAFTGDVVYGSDLSFTGPGRFFFKRGTIASTLTGFARANADGSATFSGSGRFTGGTARYRGARGEFTFAGTLPPGSQIATYTVTGSVKY